MYSVYIFEAKSVQSFILAGGRLRDIVGGSALLDWLTSASDKTAPLADLQKAFSTSDFPRAAGGAITVVFENDTIGLNAQEFRALWRLQVNAEAPGLQFADGFGVGETSGQAIKNAQEKSRASVNIRQPELPQAIPLMAQSQRLAAPAAFVKGWVKSSGVCKITEERADKATLAKRYFVSSQNNDRLGVKLANGDTSYRWPNEFDPDDCPAGSVVFPFGDSEEREIAIIHADGDAIGAKIMAVMDTPGDAGAEIKSISQNLTSATTDAAIAATKAVLLTNTDCGIVPARPVLLGGDDLTMIIRADLALDFLTRYCHEFAEQTKKRFANLADDHPFKSGISASGAAVFIKARQPFSKALRLTEALTSHAKKSGGGHISFFRCTTSKIPVSVEEAWPHDGLSHGPYDADGFKNLVGLAKVLMHEAVGRSGLRLVLDANAALSPSAFDRACKVMDARSADKPSKQLLDGLKGMDAEISANPNAVQAALRDAYLLHRLGVSLAD